MSNEWPPPVEVASPRRWRGSIVTGVAIAAVTAFVVVTMASLVSRDGGKTSAGSDVARAFESFDGSIDYDDEGYAALVDCPVGDPRALAQAVSDVVPVDSPVLAGEVFVDAYAGVDDYPAIVQCFVTSDAEDGIGPTSIGFSVSGVPSGPYLDFLTSVAYGPDIDVEIGVRRRRDGGRLEGDLFGYCYRAVDVSGCGADLVDRGNGVVVSVYLQGLDRTAEEVVTALDRIIADMVDALVAGLDVRDAPETIPIDATVADV